MVWTLCPCEIRKYYTFTVCVCSISSLGCKAHALYYIVIFGQSACTIYIYIFFFFSQSIANGTIFGERGGGLLRRKYVFRFSLEILSQKFLIIEVLREIISWMYIRNIKYRLTLSDFNQKLIFSTDYLKNFK